MQDVHDAQVAGAFYPADPDGLRHAIAAAAARALPPCIAPKVAVIPHAGLRFSGHVAATAVAPWAGRSRPVRRVVIAGPAHRFAFDGLALHPAPIWKTPLGEVPVAPDAVARLSGARLLPLAFEGEHAIELPLVMLQGMLPAPFEIVPILVGRCDAEQVAEALRQVWGGPETVVAISSDLSHFHDLARATELDRATATKVETLAAGSLTATDACGFRPLAAALRLAAERDMRATTLQLTTSAETMGDPGRVVGYGAFGLEYSASARIGEGDRCDLLRVLKAALRAGVQLGGRTPELHLKGALSPALATRRGTFVTLKHGERLRGCIGGFAPQRPLVRDVFVNAIKAGFQDPRFGPLEAGELPGLGVSVSILSHPRAIPARSEDDLLRALEPDRDGLILSDRGRSALFLPGVWEALQDPRAFLRQLKAKAGLAPDYWSDTLVARRFRAESFGADWNEID